MTPTMTQSLKSLGSPVLDYLFLFQETLHSIETGANTNLSHQFGKGVFLRTIYRAIGGKSPLGDDLCGTVTAYELLKPTPDDRISLCFMPSDTVMMCNASYLCIPRADWLKILERSNIWRR